MGSRSALAVMVLTSLALAGCSAPQEAAPRGNGAAALQARQQELTAEALASLEQRRCAALPEVTTLPGLPADELACVGAGPARPVNAGDGRPTVVNLWASWCAPCVREMPLLQAIADRAGGSVRFVGVDIEDQDASAASLLQATGVRYDQYADPDGKVRSAVRAVGLPVTLVFDADGREVARRLGEIKGSWLPDALRQAGVTLAPATSSAG